MSAHIRPLEPQDSGAWSAWRRAAWPQRVGARALEVVASKYWRNPASARCPGSGLYAYVARGEILGVIGAFPMPLRAGGGVVPGHALVDWAVLPRVRDGAIGGRLLQFGLGLPGAKLGIGGGPHSLATLESRARRIDMRMVRIVRDPIRVLAAKRLEILAEMHPATQTAAPDTAPSADLLRRLFEAPGDASVRVDRRAEDLLHAAGDAHLTGVRIWTCDAPAGAAVVARTGIGTLLALNVLAVRWEGGAEASAAFGKWMRGRIREEAPAFVSVHDSELARSAGLLTLAGPKRISTEWWWIFDTPQSPPAGSSCRFEGLDSDQVWCG